jgi:uncharacterized protein
MYYIVLQYITMIIKELMWDSWNIAHIARHQVVPEEVEQACQGFIIARETYSGRFLVLGETTAKRVLAIVLAPKPREGIYYPITAHTANRRDRRIYLAEKGGEEAA